MYRHRLRPWKYSCERDRGIPDLLELAVQQGRQPGKRATKKSCITSEEAKLEEQDKVGQGKGTRGAGAGRGLAEAHRKQEGVARTKSLGGMTQWAARVAEGQVSLSPSPQVESKGSLSEIGRQRRRVRGRCDHGRTAEDVVCCWLWRPRKGHKPRNARGPEKLKKAKQ